VERDCLRRAVVRLPFERTVALIESRPARTPGAGLHSGFAGRPALVTAVVRHWCGITTGARVLLVADRDRGQLRVYPPAALDAMIAAFDAAVLGGDPS
jgi:hypothetical protein